MDQNVGLVMFQLPHRGDGFKLRVRFKSNDRREFDTLSTKKTVKTYYMFLLCGYMWRRMPESRDFLYIFLLLILTSVNWHEASSSLFLFTACNVILQDPSGVYTLRNYGRRINCTASIMFPESIRMLSTSIGSGSVEAASARNSVETGLIRQVRIFDQSFSMCDNSVTHLSSQCRGSGSLDYVELRGGDGLDPSSMEIAADFCGVDSLPGAFLLSSQLHPEKTSLTVTSILSSTFSAANKIDILCGNTAIRLVSSGMYQNSVTFSFDLFMDPKSTGLTCAALLENLWLKNSWSYRKLWCLMIGSENALRSNSFSSFKQKIQITFRNRLKPGFSLEKHRKFESSLTAISSL